ncbi:MAG: hypothetical protein KA354_19690 [Phycisphaerae bacterium]|nr:hypothetical protein [Phycisphaerae bacterium]
MTSRFHYQTISSYRILPPKVRIIEDEDSRRTPVERYLDHVDQFLARSRPHTMYGGPGDPVSWVFGNQMASHEVSARHFAELVEERRALTQRHLRDIQWRLDELWERRPLRRRGPFMYDDGELNDVEREILELEKEKRALQINLWRDTQELRSTLVTERREADNTRRRIDYLAGGSSAGA